MTFTDLSPLSDEADFVRVCYYGDPGKGKTTAAAGVARLGRTLVYPFEPGFKKIALETQDIPTTNIFPRRPESKVLKSITEDFWRVKAALEKEPGSFAGSIFDTLTFLVDEVRKAYCERVYAQGKAEAAQNNEAYDKPKNWLPREAYGWIADDIAPIITDWADLPLHVAWTCHVRRDEDDDGEVTYSPAVTPGVRKVIAGYADIVMLMRQVGRYDDGRAVFIGTTSDGGKHTFVKDRLHVVPAPHMVQPSLDRIVAYANGKLSRETDPLQQEFDTWLSGNAVMRKNEED